MNPVERAARALYWTRVEMSPEDEGAEQCRLVVETAWPRYVNEARAVLQAIREPSEAMLKAGECDGDIPFAEEAWQLMIDAALEEE